MYAFALLLAAGPAAPPSEADLLLREMDARIAAAKALRIEFEIRNDIPGKGERVLTGTVTLGDRNRLRYEQAGWLTASAVSDGKQTVTVALGPSDRRTREAPEWFNENLKGWLGRGGTYVSAAKAFELLDSLGTERPGPADGPRTANANLLPDEEAGGVKCRVVEYDLTWVKHPAVAGAGTARVRVWIDPKTRLPVRRTMAFPIDGRTDTYTATHTKFEIDPKLDDKLFELPK